MICIDIETGPLPWDELKKLLPEFDAVAAVPDPGEFDASTVKIGNLKDASKIDDKIKQERIKHAELCQSVAGRRQAAASQHADKFIEKAALSALTGRVLAIGVEDKKRNGADKPFLWTGPENDLLSSFWTLAARCIGNGETLCGHNIHGFDLPFMVRRSWLLGIDVPDDLRTGNWWNPIFVDTMQRWQLGNRQEFVGLDAIDKALGGPGKPEGTTGADFDRMFHGTADERTQALAYLRNDVCMTRRVADAMQIF